VTRHANLPATLLELMAKIRAQRGPSPDVPALDIPAEVRSLRAHGVVTTDGKAILDAEEAALDKPSFGPGISQRWQDRRDSYRSGEGFDPRKWRVDVMTGGQEERGLSGLAVRRGTWESGKDFIVNNHYAASFPQMRVMVGLYRAGDGRLSGVATYGNAKANQAKKYGDVGLDEILELNRFVLLDDVERDGETWFLSRATDLAREVHEARGFTLKVLLSFSDPIPRRSAAGSLTMPGHIGNIYQAWSTGSPGNKGQAIFAGRSSPKVLHLDTRGVAPDPRMISKIRSLDGDGEPGGPSAAVRFVEEHGAPPRKPRESYSAWVKRALESDNFRRIEHSGNLTYLWTFGPKSFRRDFVVQGPLVRPRAGEVVDSQAGRVRFPGLPYPKNPRQLYLNLQRKGERAWSRGDVVQIMLFADQALEAWLKLTDAEREGLSPPPQVGTACGVGREAAYADIARARIAHATNNRRAP